MVAVVVKYARGSLTFVVTGLNDEHRSRAEIKTGPSSAESMSGAHLLPRPLILEEPSPGA